MPDELVITVPEKWRQLGEKAVERGKPVAGETPLDRRRRVQESVAALFKAMDHAPIKNRLNITVMLWCNIACVYSDNGMPADSEASFNRAYSVEGVDTLASSIVKGFQAYVIANKDLTEALTLLQTALLLLKGDTRVEARQQELSLRLYTSILCNDYQVANHALEAAERARILAEEIGTTDQKAQAKALWEQASLLVHGRRVHAVNS